MEIAFYLAFGVAVVMTVSYVMKLNDSKAAYENYQANLENYRACRDRLSQTIEELKKEHANELAMAQLPMPANADEAAERSTLNVRPEDPRIANKAVAAIQSKIKKAVLDGAFWIRISRYEMDELYIGEGVIRKFEAQGYRYKNCSGDYHYASKFFFWGPISKFEESLNAKASKQ